MASTDEALHPLVRCAARGELPAWAQVSARRRAHMGRVAGLLGEWADALGLAEADRQRWAAAGWLHDALRDTDPEVLRNEVPPAFAALPAPLLHGPAAAERLSETGDAALLHAIRYHTLGHPDLDAVGRALYLADFLEPGRSFRPEWTASLRERMPQDAEEVLVEVVAARLTHLIERRSAMRPETTAFWNSLADPAQ